MLIRVLTAIVLIPVVIGALFLTNVEVFRWLSLIIFSLIGAEWGNLCQFKRKSWHFIFLMGLVAILFFLPIHQAVLWIGTLFWSVPLYYCIVYSRSEKNQNLINPSVKAWMGWVALPCAYQALITLKVMNRGTEWILCLLLLIWASDSFAYFTGKAWGKRRLAPKISPNKTQEGLLGGVIGAMFVAGIIAYFLNISFLWFMIALVTVLLGVLGDLFESLLKRLVNVKDSGRLLPGHGGVFDRLDSLIAALPFYTLCLHYLS